MLPPGFRRSGLLRPAVRLFNDRPGILVSSSCASAGHGGAYRGTVDPNTADTWTRNYVESFNESHPRRNDMVRIDWNVTSKLTTWFRYINDYDNRNGGGGIGLKNGAGQVTPYSADYPEPGHGYGVGITYTINPTTVNELTIGKNWGTYDTYAHDPTQLARSTMGNPPSFDNFATDPNFVNDMNSWRPSGLAPGNENYSVFIQIGRASCRERV